MADDSQRPSDGASEDNAVTDDERARARRLARRQFVTGVSGVLVGVAACDDGADGLFDGAGGGPANTGGASPTGGASATTGGVATTGGQPAVGSGGTTGGTASTTGGTASTSGGTSSSGGARVTGGAPNGGVANGGVAGGGAPAGGAAGTSGGAPGVVGRKAASDQVMLGSTGIRVSRLAMGSGSSGANGRSAQQRLGVDRFAQVLTHGFDKQGVTFFETADAYGTHEHVGEAIRRVGRQNVVVLTKTRSEDAEGVEEDLARFREELGIDTIDIVLLHLKTSRTWTTQCEGAMTALARAKQSGAIRAHGVSCHSIEALRLAAKEPWVDVDLARINPAGVLMDDDPATVINVLHEMKMAGKGLIGMKILGEGQLVNRMDEAIKHAVGLDDIDCFTIGFTSETQLDEVVGKIQSVQS